MIEDVVQKIKAKVLEILPEYEQKAKQESVKVTGKLDASIDVVLTSFNRDHIKVTFTEKRYGYILYNMAQNPSKHTKNKRSPLYYNADRYKTLLKYYRITRKRLMHEISEIYADGASEMITKILNDL